MNRHNNIGNSLSLSRNRCLGLLAGCLLVLFIPNEAHARWEYKVINAGVGTRQLENLLNTHGKAGWELVQINNSGVAVFKRRR